MTNAINQYTKTKRVWTEWTSIIIHKALGIRLLACVKKKRHKTISFLLSYTVIEYVFWHIVNQDSCPKSLPAFVLLNFFAPGESERRKYLNSGIV